MMDIDNVDDMTPGSELSKSSTSRCPKCGKSTLTMDSAKGVIKCSNCGYEDRFPVMK
jgi:ribosomal protein S27E